MAFECQIKESFQDHGNTGTIFRSCLVYLTTLSKLYKLHMPSLLGTRFRMIKWGWCESNVPEGLEAQCPEF
jgi:hypothetical protein